MILDLRFHEKMWNLHKLSSKYHRTAQKCILQMIRFVNRYSLSLEIDLVYVYVCACACVRVSLYITFKQIKFSSAAVTQSPLSVHRLLRSLRRTENYPWIPRRWYAHKIIKCTVEVIRSIIKIVGTYFGLFRSNFFVALYKERVMCHLIECFRIRS